MDVKLFIRVVALSIVFIMQGCSEQSVVSPVHKSTDNQTITDPYEWCRANRLDLGMRRSLIERRYDLDHDGIQEVFIEMAAGGGNAGNGYDVFKKVDSAYIYMGETFFHWRAFRVLPLALDDSIRFVTYHRSSCSEGALQWWTHKNGEFQVIRAEVINPGDGGTEEGNQRYKEVICPG